MPALLVLFALILIGVAFKRKRYNTWWFTTLTVSLNLLYIGVLMFGQPSDTHAMMIAICQGLMVVWYAVRDVLGLPKEI